MQWIPRKKRLHIQMSLKICDVFKSLPPGGGRAEDFVSQDTLAKQETLLFGRGRF